jgi:hypothetical protein
MFTNFASAFAVSFYFANAAEGAPQLQEESKRLWLATNALVDSSLEGFTIEM